MRSPEEELVSILRESGVDVVATLPCERVKNLIMLVRSEFEHVGLSREEAGVGISAGVALAGNRAAMIVQNSGIGNMINALLSLTSFYKLPLPIFLSHRGVYKETIAAQVPMGEHVEGLLKAAGIGYTNIENAKEINKIKGPLQKVYSKNLIHAFLLSPRVWEGSHINIPLISERRAFSIKDKRENSIHPGRMTRYEIINEIKRYLRGKLVVCNLGFPAKELYDILDQPSNFYMLGSMGMATPIGFGLSISCSKEVMVIDGDGSLLMNPSTLSTIAAKKPRNLTIVLIDNGVYSSTGDQPTAANRVANL
ncbi:MAG: sulfopyruvate decarboxylase subunit alpha [Nitrospirota bacterium]|nr:MAG: sulfopyruvate decarboxylase subunit alpha [Nitrospirota bacterium]